MSAPPLVQPRFGVDERAEARAQVMLAVAWGTYLLGAFICLGFLLSDLNDVVGARAFAYGLLFAVAPTPLMVAVFALFDRLRPEPVQLMIVALVWGSCIATLIALKLNGFAFDHLDAGAERGIRGAVFLAPWIEEAAKAVIVFGIVWWNRHRLVTPTAAAVYGGLVGVGFAFTENVVYYSGVFQSTVSAAGDRGLALDAVTQLFWWRGVAAPFVHPLFTLTTGLGIGFAMRHRHVGARLLAPVAGYLGAVLLHTGYNALATYATDRALMALYVGILLPLVVSAVIALALIRRHERRVIAARLDDYVATGWLRPWQSDSLGTSRGRRDVLRDAARYGPHAKRQARAWLASGVELGAVRDRIVRGIASDDDLRLERGLLDAVRGVFPGEREAATARLATADAAAGSATG